MYKYKLPLSAYHKIFYYEWKINSSSCRYHVFDQILSHHLDIEKLQDALNRLIADYWLLNSHIEIEEEIECWTRNEKIEPLRCFQKLSAKKLRNHIAAPFDLEQGPLYRFSLVQEKSGYRFIIVLHHIIIDGNTFDAFLAEISNYYNNSQYRTHTGLEEQQKLIFETTLQLNKQLQFIEHQSQLSWRNYLTNTEHLDLRFIKLHKTEKTKIKKPSYLSFTLDCNTTSRLNFLQEKYQISNFLFGQIIFAILLNRYTSQKKIAISYPVVIKEHKDLIYGAGINTQIITYTIDEKTTFFDLVIQAQQWIQQIKTQKLNYYPINCILEGQDKHILSACYAKTNLKNTPFQFKDVEVIDIKHEFNIDLMFDIMFESEIKDGKLYFQIRYDEKELDKNILKNFINHYKKLFLTFLKALEKSAKSKFCHTATSNEDQKPVREYPILNSKEYQQIAHQWNKTKKEYPEDKAIHTLFEEQVEKTPDNIALIYDDTQLTYAELNARANQLANYIRQSCQISPDDLILLFLEKTEQMVIAILAVLKAGGAYVPVDTNCPEKRIYEILADTQTKLVLTQDAYKNKIANIFAINIFNPSPKLVAVDNSKSHETLMRLSKINLPCKDDFDSKKLAYVLYTSGTTGTPKGVMVKHRNVINFIFSLPFSNKKRLRATFTAPYTFDVSVFDLWSNLLHGHQLYIVNSEILRDTTLMQGFIKRHDIHKLYLPAALLKIHTYWLSQIKSIKQLLTGVESLEYVYVNKLSNIEQIINGYGPTETTVCSTLFKIKFVQEDNSIIPLGKPIHNTQIYVLDKNLSILPIGAIGELYIGGAGVTRGYLNNSELTNKKYIPNPFQTTAEKHRSENDKLYRTGDFVRMLLDGNIEYIGRNDSQVKIRGYRIELGEIENKLNSYASIQQSIVLAKKDAEKNKKNNDTHLVAYYTAEKSIDEKALYEFLADQLPSYMIPDFFIYLEKISLTSNGKIDTTALPIPAPKENKRKMQPNNIQERLICRAFADILGIKRIGIHDDFFRLGGNSLSAIKLTSLLQSHFNIKVADVFNLKTPQKLANTVLYEKNVLEKTLERIKIFYKDNKKNSKIENLSSNQLDAYFASSNLKVDRTIKKDIHTILLTGATGFLGCNILHQLLKLTNYKIIVLVRANNKQDPFRRINEKFAYYFNETLEDVFGKCVFIVKADIEKIRLGLSQKEYEDLANKVDSIIHAAALVKHYGNEDQFYSINVQGTINLLELSRLTRLRDFHYISTLSVLNFEPTLGHEEYIYTENDSPDNLDESYNIYNKTKLQGERVTIDYRQYDIKSNIYRVGNLAFISENFRAQENINDNAFFNWLKCIFRIKNIPKEISIIEVSQVDLAAKAIIKIFDKKQLNNRIYHVFNPHLINLADFFANHTFYSIHIECMDNFIDLIRRRLSVDPHDNLVLKFLLRQGWLDGQSVQNATNGQVLQLETQKILSQINFEWPPVTYVAFGQYLSKLPLLQIKPSNCHTKTKDIISI